uniref:5-hydroxytryptamine receptor 4 isoform X4 n=1 Tax=Gasterosteus aculeatus aculeatus TaxID=481459 RepID=UPI001A9936C7|nr:5-hydroxytryptamine receptor 4 isoform X4 [Gasterosteus aculeatus aculeatus]
MRQHAKADSSDRLPVSRHADEHPGKPAGHGGRLQGPTTQENQDQLLHRVSGVRRPAGLGAGDAVRCHRTGPPALDLRRDLLPGPDISGRPADHRVHTAPVLHRLGQIEERRYSEGTNSTSCVFMVNKPYALTCSVVAFYIPLVLMVLAYQRIYVTARAHALQISVLQRAGGAGVGADSADHQRNHRMRTETKAAKTLCIIMGCFCLCWAPFFITNVVDPFIDYTVPDKLWVACLWLGYINSMLNPILYAFLNKSFRRAFLIILCCGRKRYRRPSLLGAGAACTATQINSSTHVLKYSVLQNGNHSEQKKKSLPAVGESHESCL